MKTPKPYAARRTLRILEKRWAYIEGIVNHLTKSDFNPLYHLGTLSIFLSIILFFTGLYLTLLYRPGIGNAFQTVEAISATWFGSLMRSMHKYASDVLILVLILHFLKMLFGDRFWGARWLAWTSGWIMLVVTWLVGTMGYWLIWDQRSPWLTELMMEISGSASALTYTASDLAATTYSNFVIILFLHVFIPLLGFVGIYLHVLRLSRAKWWAPRWLMIQTTLGITLLAIIKPVTSAIPADLSQIITSVSVDTLFLGFLPIMDQWGNWVSAILAIFVLGSLFLLPWLWRGANLGPAVVSDENCTGCNLCFSVCPYDAIRMQSRNEPSNNLRLAVVNPAQCTGCGVCVGACLDDAIDLKNMNANEVFDQLTDTLTQEKGNRLVVVFTGQRERILTDFNLDGPSAYHQRISVASWENNPRNRIVTVTLPSIGALRMDWIAALADFSLDGVVILTGPIEDSPFREDTFWLYTRLRRRSALLESNLYWLAITLGDTRSLTTMLEKIYDSGSLAKSRLQDLPPTKNRTLLKPTLKSSIISTIMLTLFFAIAFFVDLPGGRVDAELSGLRIALDAKGKISQFDIPQNYNLPEGADPAEIFGGSHYPISLRMMIGGEIILDKTYQPAGISRNGRISGVEYIKIEPGMHQIQLAINDDDQSFREVFHQEVEFLPSQVILFEYLEESDSISIRR